jgi:hypothetical protein
VPALAVGPTQFLVRVDPIRPPTGIIHALQVEVVDLVTNTTTEATFFDGITLGKACLEFLGCCFWSPPPHTHANTALSAAPSFVAHPARLAMLAGNCLGKGETQSSYSFFMQGLLPFSNYSVRVRCSFPAALCLCNCLTCLGPVACRRAL